MKKQPGTIYAFVRKDQHVRLMADAMRHLQTAGHKVRLIQHVGNRGALNTLAQIRQERLPFTYAR